jgi:hypothetical protein
MFHETRIQVSVVMLLDYGLNLSILYVDDNMYYDLICEKYTKFKGH